MAPAKKGSTARKKTASRTSTPKKPAPAKPTPAPNIATLSLDEFREFITEKYHLKAHHWWQARDKKSGRVTYILHQSALDSIARQEKLKFSDPLIHEVPGHIILHLDSPDGDNGKKQVVLNLPTKQPGTVSNGARWCLSGSCWKPGDEENAVSAVASASESAKGDSVGYGSPFLGAHNRLRARLIRSWIGAEAFPIYGQDEAVDFETPLDADQEESEPTNSGSPPKTEPAPEKPAERTNEVDQDKSKGKGEALSFSAPKTASAPKFGGDPKPAPKRRAKAKPKAEPKPKPKPEPEPEPEQDQAPDPVLDPTPDDDGPPEEPEAKPKAADKPNVTAERMKKYLDLDPPARYEALVKEIRSENVTNPVHLLNLWKHAETVARTLEEPYYSQLQAEKESKRNDLIQKLSFKDAGNTGKKTPQAAADRLCAALQAAESGEKLVQVWELHLPVFRKMSERLKDQCIRVKDARKSELGLS